MRPDKGKDTFERKVFRSSRLAEFATVPEMIRQTGHPAEDWPLVIVKELADNALDAAEGAGIAPEIEIVVAADAITVSDYGPGIAPATVESLIDYSVKTSSRAAYVSPTRGAQGNALQTILAMPFVLAQGQQSEVLIESQGITHTVCFAIDPVRQTPVVSCLVEPSEVRNGTRITVRWPDSASSILAHARPRFLSLVSTFTTLNPHLTIGADWRVSESPVRLRDRATDPNWSKWRPDLPTSAHWYSVERLKGLMAAEIAFAQDHGTVCPSVRDFIRQFRGLTGTTKAGMICKEIDVAERASLKDFHAQGTGVIARLLSAMRKLSQPVKPRDLGVVGRDHLLARFTESGADPVTFVYRYAAVEHDGLPFFIEAAFAYRGDDDERGADVIEGFNFTPAIGGSPFRLEGHLAEARVQDYDPVIAFVHLTSPGLDFLDRGKAQVALPAVVAGQIVSLVKGVTAKWSKQKRAEIRDAQARTRRWLSMARRDRPTTIKEAAYAVMPSAYMTASANDTLPANPRQIYYAARGPILAMTGQTALSSQYFSQTLLVDYVEEQGVDWDIVWDDRGHFREPHTDHEIGLGTLAVRDYVARLRVPEIKAAEIAAAAISTLGPAGRYGAVLFIEKEGFTPVLEAARIPERFDIAPMSTKGMSVTAARLLIDELCGRLGLRLFSLHDFDIAGFSIKKTLTADSRRYKFKHEIIDPIDLGLRLADVERLSLESESVAIDRDEDALARRLRINGALDPEIEFLLSGRRVELNAMTSDVFVRFVEGGLSGHGVTKVVPTTATLAETYAAVRRAAMARRALEAELARLNGAIVETPADLEQRVRDHLAAHPEETWDAAIRAVGEADEAA